MIFTVKNGITDLGGGPFRTHLVCDISQQDSSSLLLNLKALRNRDQIFDSSFFYEKVAIRE